jgi:hypothetical protein
LDPGEKTVQAVLDGPSFSAGSLSFRDGSRKTTPSQDYAPDDVPIVQVPYEEVVKSDNVVVSSITPLASARVGVAVKKGAPKPDISSAEAVKHMLLTAKSVVYPLHSHAPRVHLR